MGFRFVLHGGEPLLLPDNYLVRFSDYLRSYLDPLKIVYETVLQTNLFHVKKTKIELLKQLGIRLGVSVDVFGDQRVTALGKDSQDRVLDNLQMLNDIGYLDSPGVGAISVLHRENMAQAELIYDFFNELRISYRILPIESGAIDEVPERFRHLMISNEEKVQVLKRIADRHARLNRGIQVLPLDDYEQSARRYLAGAQIGPYDFPSKEWALIINTNGDAYNSGDEYRSQGFVGNVFQQTLSDIFAGQSYAAADAMRRARMQTCNSCPYGHACTRIPVAEMQSSEREYGSDSRLKCAVAHPMIDDYIERIRAHTPILAPS